MYTCLPQFTPLRHNGTLSQKILFLALKFSVVVTTMIYCFGEFKDFCNALLSGSSQDFIDRLVKVPNNQKGVYRPSKFNHVLPLLYNLHWFPEERKKKKKRHHCAFRLILNSSGPQYPARLLQLHTTFRTASLFFLVLRRPSPGKKLIGPTSTGTLSSVGDMDRHAGPAVLSRRPRA